MKTNRIISSLAALALTGMLTVSCSKDEKRPELPQGTMPQEKTEQVAPDTSTKAATSAAEPAKMDNSGKNDVASDKPAMKGAPKSEAATPAANSNEHKGYFALLTKLAAGEDGRFTGDPGMNPVVFVTGGNAYYPVAEDGAYIGKIFGKKYGATNEVTAIGKMSDRNGVSCIMITEIK